MNFFYLNCAQIDEKVVRTCYHITAERFTGKKELPCIQVSMSFKVNNFLNTLIASQTKISMGVERKAKLSAEIETIDEKIKEMRD